MYTLLYADKKGNIFDAPGMPAYGRSADDIVSLDDVEMIPLPEGADLMYLPGRQAYAGKGKSPGLAVAAILPAGYTRLLVPAFTQLAGAPRLPLYGYTAVALRGEEVVVAAVKTDEGSKWNPLRFNDRNLRRLVKEKLQKYPKNRILQQLAHCSLDYHCCTAQNIFYQRWEGGVPVSPACNARCFGCISLQPSECCPSPQQRINFIPSDTEIAEVMIDHLEHAPEAIISFGQGCEGEPSLQAERIADAIRKTRQSTHKGMININSNAGNTEGIKKICKAGLDSMRVSLISARVPLYTAYYDPIGYTLDNVRQSIKIAKEHEVYVSLNLLVFPGVTDRVEEVSALEHFIADTGVDMIQMRNLNADPDAFMNIVPPAEGETIGIANMMTRLQERLPKLHIGSYSRYIKG